MFRVHCAQQVVADAVVVIDVADQFVGESVSHVSGADLGVCHVVASMSPVNLVG